MLRIVIVHLISSTQHQILVQMVVFQWCRKWSSSCGCFVRMPFCQEIWKFNAQHCRTLPYAAHDWGQVRCQLLRLAGLRRQSRPLVPYAGPRPGSRISGLLPCSRSPSSGLSALRIGVASGKYLLDPLVWSVGMPSTTLDMLAFPGTCKMTVCILLPLSMVSTRLWVL